MFHETQTFLVDPSVVGGAAEVSLTKVRLFFRAKPNSTGNKSGIVEPGVTLYILPVLNGVPDVRDVLNLPWVRVDYTSIQVSSDATAYTDFVFPEPVQIRTGAEWAFSVSYDGSEDFLLWSSRQGDTLVASDQRSPGSSGQYVGKYFTYITGMPGVSEVQTVDSSFTSPRESSIDVNTSQDFLSSNWKPRTDVDLKFSVFCARYRNNGSSNLTPLVPANTPASAAIKAGSIYSVQNSVSGSITYRIPSRRYERIVYDRSTSMASPIRPGHTIWQKAPFYPNDKSPHTASVTANSTTVTTSTSNFNTLFGASTDDSYLVAVSENHDGPGLHTAAARRVLSITSNTALVLAAPMPFTNSAVKFYKAPVGSVYSIGPRQVSRLTSAVDIVDSSANGTVRFVNSTIESVSVVAGGTGYNNADTITINGFQNVAGKVVGGYSARAVLTTNSTGGVTNVFVSNAGAGFVNTTAITFSVSNSSGGSSSGSGANLSFSVGMTLLSEQAYTGQDGYVKGGIVSDVDVTNSIIPSLGSGPLGTFMRASLRLPYYKQADASVLGGVVTHCDDADSENDVVELIPATVQTHVLTKQRVVPSWSNEQVITYRGSGNTVQGRGTQANTVLSEFPGASNSAVIQIDAASNNDYVTLSVPPFLCGLGSYNINGSANNENTNYGDALAKGVTTKFAFANGSLAEDVRVYVNAYRPSGTDVKVYARVHNSSDFEAFDDKDWTELEVKEGSELFSSRSNKQDYVRLTYGFPSSPLYTTRLTGTVSTTFESANVVGTGTSFNTDLANGSVVKIFSPLFPESYLVTPVLTVTNATHLVLSAEVSNVGLSDSGLAIERLDRPNQVFNNPLNDNVARYYSETLVEYDAYDSIQLKIVMISDSVTVIPRVADYGMVGVSA